MSCFICSTFVPGLACYSLQWRFFPSLWEFTVSWETCLDLYLKKKSEMHWYFWFYKTFSTHESSILATLVAACLFPDFMFYFHSHRWCDFCLCGILLIWSSMLVVLVLIVLKSSVCWRRQCWRYSLYLCIYRIPYPENPLFSPSERSGLHRAPEIRELSFL